MKFSQLLWALLAALCVALAWEQTNIVPLILAFPVAIVLLTLSCKGFWEGLWYGFLTSFFVAIGTSYWMVYAIHEFLSLSWIASVIAFIFIGALIVFNFAVFTALATFVHGHVDWKKRSTFQVGLWFVVGLPALFTVVEYLVPKLFPWSIGHCLYRQTWLTQIVEVTGESFLTFGIFSLGSALGLLFVFPIQTRPKAKLFLAVPATLWTLAIVFSYVRLNESPDYGRTLRVAMIQPNISHWEKVAAEKGADEKVQFVIRTLSELTEGALALTPKPELIIWPETAIPSKMNLNALIPNQVRSLVKKWNVPVISGGYVGRLQDDKPVLQNSAVYIEPSPSREVAQDYYSKSMLVPFAERIPVVGSWPIIKKMFPEIADFTGDSDYSPFVLRDGTKVGTTICYEAIFPEVLRKVVEYKPHLILNLSNDSWYGPTSEPYLHASLATFRAIESRLPLLRATNTGVSFWVNERGLISPMTNLNERRVVAAEIPLPRNPPVTFYMKHGEWFVALSGLCFVVAIALLRPNRILRRRGRLSR